MKDENLIPLPKTEVVKRIKPLPSWKYESNKIVKMFEFDSFTLAIQFVNGLVGFCNYLNHHPNITISYKKVKFELSTFSAGGKVTAKDITVAKKIEDDFQKYIGKKVS